MTRTPPPTWTVTLRPEGDGPPPAIRVRRLLKAALRAYGLRCVAVNPTTDDGGHVARPLDEEPEPPARPAEDRP